MKWKRYSQYKDSDIEWLGEIPKGWGVRKLKHIASIKFSNVDKKITEGQQPVRICNYIDVYYNDFITSDLKLMKASASTEEIAMFSLKEGDVLITKDSESWDDIAVPAYVSLDLAGVVCGYHLAQVRPKTVLVYGKYLFRSFCFHGINYQYRVEATGITRYGLGKYWIDNSFFILPPKEEQQTIAVFLDRETSRIDKLIEKKEKQIELLKEKRVALISHAVTKGLDPNVKMKDSGIQWLGEIPKQWKLLRAKFCAEINMGQSPNSEDCNTEGIGLPFLQGNAEFGPRHPTPKQYCDVARKSSRAGDLLISVRAPVGALNIAEQDIGIGRGLCGIAPSKSHLNSTYCWYLLHLVRKQLNFNATGSTYDAVSAEDVCNMILVIPPEKEQEKIASFLDNETGKIDTLVEKVQKSIELLKEYRMAIISAAVTGKIDLRGAG
jgi:type I restriction enzyme S subunit